MLDIKSMLLMGNIVFYIVWLPISGLPLVFVLFTLVTKPLHYLLSIDCLQI
jgi:hypothetical protein